MTGSNRPFVLCRDCGLAHALPPPVPGHRAECVRCGAVLRHHRSGSLERCAALTSAALILFVLANLFPVLTFELEGRVQSATLAGGVLALWTGGFPELAALVGVVLLAAPLLEMVATLHVVLPLGLGRRPPPGAAWALRLVIRLRPWAMAEVFLLGLLVAYVKLSDLATVVAGPSLPALLGFVLLQVWGEASLGVADLWERLAPQTRVGQAAATGGLRLTACRDCGQVVAGQDGDCPRCAAGLHRRKPDSLRRCSALVAAAAILYVPANLLPVMTVIHFGTGHPDTILSGVQGLIAAEMWPVAILVFFASVTVPVLKLAGLSYLLVSVRRRSARRRRDRTRLYRLIETVGRWSMVDIFMIALLAALVKLGAIASVQAELGAVAFAAVVVITMMASDSFDPRLIWDAAGREVPHG